MKLKHVPVIPFPAQGHVNPLMHLSHKLAQHGCKVILQENMQELIDDGIMDTNGKSYNFHSLLNFTISDKSQKLLVLNFIELQNIENKIGNESDFSLNHVVDVQINMSLK
ncbi:hypothetical protein HN873_059009 [Arachis hypogaea]